MTLGCFFFTHLADKVIYILSLKLNVCQAHQLFYTKANNLINLETSVVKKIIKLKAFQLFVQQKFF